MNIVILAKTQPLEKRGYLNIPATTQKTPTSHLTFCYCQIPNSKPSMHFPEKYTTACNFNTLKHSQKSRQKTRICTQTPGNSNFIWVFPSPYRLNIVLVLLFMTKCMSNLFQFFLRRIWVKKTRLWNLELQLRKTFCIVM